MRPEKCGQSWALTVCLSVSCDWLSAGLCDLSPAASGWQLPASGHKTYHKLEILQLVTTATTAVTDKPAPSHCTYNLSPRGSS